MSKISNYKRIKNLALRLFLKQDKEVQLRHAERVAFYAHSFAPLLGIDPDLAWLAGFLHDLGKMERTVFQILKEAEGRKLTSKEWKTVRKHPLYSVEILKGLERQYGIKIPRIVLLGVKYHQVWYNGKRGYPQGKKYKEEYKRLPSKTKEFISLIQFSDVIDAMLCRVFTHSPDRVYDWFSGHHNFKGVMREIYGKARGRQLHPHLVDALKNFIPNLKEVYKGI